MHNRLYVIYKNGTKPQLQGTKWMPDQHMRVTKRRAREHLSGPYESKLWHVNTPLHVCKERMQNTIVFLRHKMVCNTTNPPQFVQTNELQLI